MKKLFLPLLLALTCLTMLPGCSSVVERIGLQVQLVKLEKNADGSLLASLQFGNPNVTSVNVASSIHQLTLNGRPAGVLEITEAVGLPAQRTILTTAILKSPNVDIAAAGSVSYQLSSTLVLSIYDDKIERFKTSSSGTVAME